MYIERIARLVLVVSGLVIGASAFAGAPKCIAPPPPPASPWYVTVGGGYAWSNRTSIDIDYNGYWPQTVEGYTSNLGQSPFITLGVGKRLCSLLMTEVTSSYFSSFQYRRFQTEINNPPINNVFRHFDLTNLNIMFNVILNKPNFGFNLCNTQISPFIGGGIGPALNTVSDFYSITDAGIQNSTGVTSSTRKVTFAAQGEAGLAFNLTRTTAVDIGYRYYYGGRFRGPSDVFATAKPPAFVANVPPWKGSLTANLLFVNMRFGVQH